VFTSTLKQHRGVRRVPAGTDNLKVFASENSATRCQRHVFTSLSQLTFNRKRIENG